METLFLQASSRDIPTFKLNAGNFGTASTLETVRLFSPSGNGSVWTTGSWDRLTEWSAKVQVMIIQRVTKNYPEQICRAD
eukprot:s281_g28.t1